MVPLRQMADALQSSTARGLGCVVRLDSDVVSKCHATCTCVSSGMYSGTRALSRSVFLLSHQAESDLNSISYNLSIITVWGSWPAFLSPSACGHQSQAFAYGVLFCNTSCVRQGRQTNWELLWNDTIYCIGTDSILMGRYGTLEVYWGYVCTTQARKDCFRRCVGTTTECCRLHHVDLTVLEINCV